MSLFVQFLGCENILKGRTVFARDSETVSTDSSEGQPVPIPNTEVKLANAENTWLETARENRKVLTQKREASGFTKPDASLFLYAMVLSNSHFVYIQAIVHTIQPKAEQPEEVGAVTV